MTRKRLSLQELNLSDDFLFGQVMNDTDIIHDFLEHLLDVKIKELKIIDTQKIVSPTYELKGVRLDVFIRDMYNNTYNIEMQNSNNDSISKRMRYYQSAIDVVSLDKSAGYKELGNNYIIFICPFDLFNKGYARYDFEYICELQDCNLKLNDGTHKILLNANGININVDTVINDFLKYLYNSNQETAEQSCDFVQKIHQKVLKVKSNKEIEVEFMSVQEKYFENFEEGKQEGRLEGRLEGRKIGFEEGKQEGRLEGKLEGRKIGFEEGKSEGFKEGKSEGKSEGKLEGKLEGEDNLIKIIKYLKAGMSEEDILKEMGNDFKATIEKARNIL